jgi:hypothetical protein
MLSLWQSLRLRPNFAERSANHCRSNRIVKGRAEHPQRRFGRLGSRIRIGPDAVREQHRRQPRLRVEPQRAAGKAQVTHALPRPQRACRRSARRAGSVRIGMVKAKSPRALQAGQTRQRKEASHRRRPQGQRPRRRRASVVVTVEQGLASRYTAALVANSPA